MSESSIKTGTEQLLARVEDGVAILTMNRPERRNALSSEMLEGLALALREAETSTEIRCVVLTGAGQAFCSGGDVKGMAERNPGGRSGSGAGIDARIHLQRLSHRETSGRIYRMPKPVIASIPGAAAGAGLALALACDLRIAAQSAVFVTAFARVGFSGDYGGSLFLTQLVGSAKARELYYLSPRLDAAEAERLGIVNRVVPDVSLAAETAALARQLASGPTVAYRYMKENLNRAAGAALEDCLDLEATHHIHTGLTEDHREAARAFVEKREPMFKGR